MAALGCSPGSLLSDMAGWFLSFTLTVHQAGSTTRLSNILKLVT